MCRIDNHYLKTCIEYVYVLYSTMKYRVVILLTVSSNTHRWLLWVIYRHLRENGYDQERRSGSNTRGTPRPGTKKSASDRQGSPLSRPHPHSGPDEEVKRAPSIGRERETEPQTCTFNGKRKGYRNTKHTHRYRKTRHVAQIV